MEQSQEMVIADCVCSGGDGAVPGDGDWCADCVCVCPGGDGAVPGDGDRCSGHYSAPSAGHAGASCWESSQQPV